MQFGFIGLFLLGIMTILVSVLVCPRLGPPLPVDRMPSLLILPQLQKVAHKNASYARIYHTSAELTHDTGVSEYFHFDFRRGRVFGHGTNRRMPPYVEWLNHHVMPRFKNRISESGPSLFLPIDLQDGTVFSQIAAMTYIGQDTEVRVCQIPDPWLLERLLFADGENDHRAWADKKDKALFIGSSTGHEGGQRLKYCRRFKDERTVTDFYISIWCQGIKYDKNLAYSTMSVQQQLEYKFIISLDGNAASWGRLSWALASNSVILKSKSPWTLWYYDLMENEKQYVEFDENNLIPTVEALIANPERCQRIIEGAHDFYQQFLSLESVVYYWEQLIFQWLTVHG